MRSAKIIETAGGQICVRPFCAASDVAPCREIYYRTRRETFGWVPPARFKRSDFLVDTLGEEIFVAELAGHVIAFAGVHLSNHFLHHLYVAREYQGCGVGSTLLRHVLDEADGRLRLKCLCRNERARAFYRRQGWREGERGQDSFGEWVAVRSPRAE